MIGLYDQDLVRFLHIPFNLELMKLSGYYKNNNQIVRMSPVIDPEKYQKFYYQKDYDDFNYRADLNKYSNVIKGGLAYTNGIYAPMDEKIEISSADTTIYNSFDLTCCTTKEYIRTFKYYLDGTHFRISLNGKDIWKNFEKQLRNHKKNAPIIIHDNTIGEIKGSFDLISDIFKNTASILRQRNITIKYPIILTNNNDFEKWLKFTDNFFYFTYKFQGLIDDTIISKIPLYFLTLTSYKSLIYEPILPSDNEEAILKEKLPILFKQLIFLHEKQNKITLIIKKVFDNKKLERLIYLLFYWYKYGKYNLFKYCSALPTNEKNLRPQEAMTRQEARELFLFAGEENYELFLMFYSSYKIELKGGKFELV